MPATSRWHRLGPVFQVPVDAPAWASHAQAPTVLALHARRWRIWVAGRDAGNRSRPFRIDVDPGADFRVLEADPAPVLEPGAPGAFDEHGLGPACALRVDGQVHLYYTGIAQRSDVPYQLAIGLATSDDDGLTFRRASPGPVIDIGPRAPVFVSTPCVWAFRGGLRAMLMTAIDWIVHDGRQECRYELRGADSTDGVHWRIDEVPAIALAPGEAGLARPWVLPEDGGWRMWFAARGLAGFRDGGPDGYRLHSAWSADGRHWRREGEVAFATPPAAPGWDAAMQAYPCVVPHAGRRVMVYCGNGFGRDGFGVAIEER